VDGRIWRGGADGLCLVCGGFGPAQGWSGGYYWIYVTLGTAQERSGGYLPYPPAKNGVVDTVPYCSGRGGCWQAQG
jgi:hypothetical protein